MVAIGGLIAMKRPEGIVGSKVLHDCPYKELQKTKTF